MNKIYDALRGLFGHDPANPDAPGPVLVDPGEVLFTLPTLADDTPLVEPLTDAPPRHGLVLHEDDWRQLEFLPAAQLPESQRLLRDFKTFEATHREASGWRQAYPRVLSESIVIPGVAAEAELVCVLGATPEPTPLICTSETVLGCLTGGFSLPIGNEVTLYGFTNAAGIAVLGASLGEHADHQCLVRAFCALNARYGVVLVDWCQQRVIVGQGEQGLQVWQA